jgi:EAL domain-containing protein (putative c-di-GMP-specific phosphodiesterase class I)
VVRRGHGAALIAHGEIEQGIRSGLEHGQFVPYFEPQIDLATGEIVGFEVLARWNHPLSGVIAPDVFIPVAEEIGLIGRLSEHVIGEALCGRLRTGIRRSRSPSTSRRPSSPTAGSPNASSHPAGTGFPAERLVIEVTESSLFADIDLARSIVDQPEEPGNAARARRFRHGLLVAVAPAVAAVRHHQDRPQLRD